MGIEFTNDGKLAFVAIGRANRLAVVDTATYEVKDFILIGQRPWHMALSPDGKKLYTANGLTNDMTVVDVESLKAERSVPVGRLPWGDQAVSRRQTQSQTSGVSKQWEAS